MAKEAWIKNIFCGPMQKRVDERSDCFVCNIMWSRSELYGRVKNEMWTWRGIKKISWTEDVIKKYCSKARDSKKEVDIVY